MHRVALGYCFWPNFTEHFQGRLLTVSGFQLATLLKKRFWQRWFSGNFTKFLGISLDRTPSDDCFLSLFVNFQKFFRTPLLYSNSEKLLISCTSCRISTSRYSGKLFHRCFLSILARMRSSHSKVFIYRKSSKIICIEVNS